MASPDKLAELFRLQKELNHTIGIDADGLSEADRQKWILNFCRALGQELAELTDSVPWKWWAKYQKFDEQNVKVEIVDMLHFLISLAQVAGMSSDDLFNAYTGKHKVNVARQDSGYSIKDEGDSKHI